MSAELNPVFNPTRLTICAYLSGCREADFSAVQEYAGVSQSTLSKALTQLLDEGLVSLRKTAAGRYTKTVLALTPHGATALTEHLAALQTIADQAAHAAHLEQ